MAPESDIDLLFILPYKQTAWGEQVAEAILYCLWDMGLKVGHATRSVDESIRQARGDMTIRTAILETRFLTGDRPLYDELVERFDKEVVQGTAAEFVTRQACRARRTAPPRRTIALSGRAQRQGWQGRLARSAHAFLDCEICLSRTRDDELLERGVFDAQEYRTFRRCAISCGRSAAISISARARAKNGCHSTSSARSRIRLGYTSHPACRMSNAS